MIEEHLRRIADAVERIANQIAPPGRKRRRQTVSLSGLGTRAHKVIVRTVNRVSGTNYNVDEEAIPKDLIEGLERKDLLKTVNCGITTALQIERIILNK